MNDRGRKEDASARIVGREFIIIIVVVFSSLSFALGFFVGKNNAEKKREYVVQTAPKPPYIEPQQNAATLQSQPPKAEDQLVATEEPVRDKKTDQRPVSLPPESRTEAEKAGLGHKGAVSNLPKEAKKEVEEPAETDYKPDDKPVGNQITYTVQLGALKNAEEARRLKAKYSKKGYKIYISAARNKHKEKIFKVRSGEFKEKKDAEILALRFKKNEGLAAFVTATND